VPGIAVVAISMPVRMRDGEDFLRLTAREIGQKGAPGNREGTLAPEPRWRGEATHTQSSSSRLLLYFRKKAVEPRLIRIRWIDRSPEGWAGSLKNWQTLLHE